MKVAPLLRTLACGIAAAGAQAEGLYGYVDGAGVAHFADRALDSRYAPVLRPRGGKGGDADGDASGRVPGKTMARGDLLTWLEFAPEVKGLQPVLREAERATGVDAELLKAVIAVESGYRTDLRSPHGAVGLMQLTPDAADRYATPSEVAARNVRQRLRDPRANVLVGARMLADLTRRFGRYDLALAAWNAGEGSVRRAGGQMPDLPETRAHVHLVLELYWALLQQRGQAHVRGISLARDGAAAPRAVPVP